MFWKKDENIENKEELNIEVKDDAEVEVDEIEENIEENIEEGTEEAFETEEEISEINGEDTEGDTDNNKFVIGIVGHVSDKQKEVIKQQGLALAGMSNKLGYTEIEVVELSENEEENEGIHVDVKIDKNKPLPKFIEAGANKVISGKFGAGDLSYLMGSGKNRKATKKKRRK